MTRNWLSRRAVLVAALMVLLLFLPTAGQLTLAQDDPAIGGISGIVSAADGVTPIDMAAVYVYDYVTSENLGLAFTAPDGWYSIDYLLPGTYLVKAVSMHSVTQYADGGHAAEGAPPILVTGGAIASDVNFALQPAALFAGIVTEIDGVTPLARAAVYAFDAASGDETAWTETRADGSFTLSVPAGTYHLSAYQFDYQARTWHSDPTRMDAEALTIAAGELRDGLVFPLAEFGVLSGAVYLPDGVTPAAGVTVFVYDRQTATTQTYSTTTLPNGTYSRPVLEGTYYVGTTNVSYGSVYYNQKLTLSVADPVSIPPNTQVSGIVMRYFGTSGNATLLVSVNLQGRPARPNAAWSIPIAVTLTAQGAGTPIYAATLTSSDNGVLTIENVPPGAYTLRVKGAHTLRNAIALIITSGGNIIDAGTLREGDANGDNAVNITDFSILAATFGKTAATDGFDARADFNNDGVVNITDFSLLASNFGQVGAA